MTTAWQLTIDCAAPARLAQFWAGALGYVPSPVPEGFPSWDAWFDEHGVPQDERDTGAFLSDPGARAPSLSFLQVPEPKSGKNRLHLDLRVSGGRHLPWQQRWERIGAEVERLVGLGARVVEEFGQEGRPDHVVLADPEGNEFCVV